MKTEEAYELLHPDTTRDAVIRIQEANGTHAALKAIEEACVIACEALEKQMSKRPVDMKQTDKFFGYYACPMCNCCVGTDEYMDDYCANCGQNIDWSGKYKNDK